MKSQQLFTFRLFRKVYSVKLKILPLLLQIGFFLCVSQYSLGQAPYGELNKRIIPQPPNVASLLKFNEVPVNHFNGTANINIPLFAVKEAGADLPVSLNYHTGGIRVNEEAGWVGLGWDCSIAGVIQEIIVGEPDYENHSISMADYHLAPKPYPAPGGNPWTINTVQAGLCHVDANGQIASYASVLYNSIHANFEYDLYSFNFSGHSGKFIFPDFQNGLCLDKQNIVFRKINVGGSTTGISAVTPDGTQYFFEIIGTISTPRFCNMDPYFTLPIKSRTFYLSKIVYTNNSEVTFTYNKTTSKTLPSLNQNWNYKQFPPNINGSGGSHNVSQSYSTIENYYLSDIFFSNGRINFITSGRLDMENALKLDAIQLFTGNGVALVKQVDFTYDYFTGTGDDWTTSPLWTQSISCSGMISYTPEADHKTKRLKLLKAKITDLTTGPTVSPSYTFDYSGPQIPNKTSLSQDLWGFYNGRSNLSLLPDYTNLGYWDNDIPYQNLSAINLPPLGNRSVATDFAKAGSLTRITYPTGGYSVLNYESNTAKSWTTGSTTIVDKLVAVTDISTGIKQSEFIIPSIGYQVYDPALPGMRDGNPSTISVTLFCCPGSHNCSSDGSAQSQSCSIYEPQFPTQGLYAKLEYFDTQINQWILTPDRIYDASKNIVINNHGIFDINEGLKPGRYRITANYPDNAPLPGGYLNRVAEIKVRYKISQTNQSPPVITAGGLRIGSILDYSNDGSIATQRHFRYSAGKLMTHPIFYRKYTPNNISRNYSADCSANHINDNANNGIRQCNTCGTGVIIPASPLDYTDYSLYSNPLINYSFSAQGALVGYDTVVITQDENGTNGKKAFIYNCIPDEYSSYGALVNPGTPTSPHILNGSLKKQIDSALKGDHYVPVRSTEFQYGFSTDIKWCFKTEYHPVWVYGDNCPGCRLEAEGLLRPTQLLLNFYPIKFSKLNMVQKTETLHDGSNSLPLVTYYTYNDVFQLRRTSTTNSTGKSSITETYYPPDFTSNDILQEMRNRNMLDYPIEVINSTDNLATNSVYHSYSLHDGIITPHTSYVFNTSSPVSLTPAAPANTKDSRYLPEIIHSYNANGNLVSLQKSNDSKKSYIWDYSNSYPIAEAVNAAQADIAYTSFEADGTGGWSFTDAARNQSFSITGKQSYELVPGKNITKSGLSAGISFIVSYWSRNGAVTVNGVTASSGVTKNGYTYYQHLLPVNTTSVTVSGSNNIIDELRLFPAGAQMTTYTYNPLIGISSQCDARNNITYFEYDGMARLLRVLDIDRNILKQFQYQYQNP